MRTKKTTLKTLLVMMLTIISVFANTLVVFAAEGGSNGTIQGYLNENSTLPSNIATYFHSSDSSADTQYDATYSVYSANGKYYYIKSSDEEKVVSLINNKNSDTQAAADVSDITVGLNIKADTQTASTALSGFVPILSTVLGLMVVLISIGMTVFSAFDLCYIAFPVFRNKCEDMKQSGNRMGTKQGSNGETKLRFVSDDAQYAVIAADTTQSGKNPFVIYFSKRLLSYIILAILLFILLTGNITIFTNLALKGVSGILELIGNI